MEKRSNRTKSGSAGSIPSAGSFSQACTRTAESRVAQHLLRPRCTFGRTAFMPSFSLPVGCHPTLVPEAGEVRFLQGTEPRQVNKRNHPRQNLSTPKVQPRQPSEASRTLNHQCLKFCAAERHPAAYLCRLMGQLKPRSTRALNLSADTLKCNFASGRAVREANGSSVATEGVRNCRRDRGGTVSTLGGNRRGDHAHD